MAGGIVIGNVFTLLSQVAECYFQDVSRPNIEAHFAATLVKGHVSPYGAVIVEVILKGAVSLHHAAERVSRDVSPIVVLAGVVEANDVRHVSPLVAREPPFNRDGCCGEELLA